MVAFATASAQASTDQGNQNTLAPPEALAVVSTTTMNTLETPGAWAATGISAIALNTPQEIVVVNNVTEATTRAVLLNFATDVAFDSEGGMDLILPIQDAVMTTITAQDVHANSIANCFDTINVAASITCSAANQATTTACTWNQVATNANDPLTRMEAWEFIFPPSTANEFVTVTASPMGTTAYTLSVDSMKTANTSPAFQEGGCCGAELATVTGSWTASYSTG
jgi:hypothetical protein